MYLLWGDKLLIDYSWNWHSIWSTPNNFNISRKIPSYNLNLSCSLGCAPWTRGWEDAPRPHTKTHKNHVLHNEIVMFNHLIWCAKLQSSLDHGVKQHGLRNVCTKNSDMPCAAAPSPPAEVAIGIILALLVIYVEPLTTSFSPNTLQASSGSHARQSNHCLYNVIY